MSAITPYQPSLPPEGSFTDAEIDFMESEPPTLFPENQNSNFGFIIRKLFTDRIQELIDQQDTIYNERFVDTSTQFLDEWEIQESLPSAPSGLDVVTRQSIVLNRVRKGPFTRTMRRNIVENYIGATFGTPADFSPAGLVLGAGGLPMYVSAGSVRQLYEIIEDVPNYLYQVNIDSTLTVATGMARELARVTPAGISFTVNSVANAAPRLYWELNDPVGSAQVADKSPFAHPGTPAAGITLGQAQSFDTLTSALFNNSGTGLITSTYAPFVVGSSRTFMGWAYRSAAADFDTLFQGQGDGLAFAGITTAQSVQFRTSSSTVTWSTAWPGNGQWVHWAITYNDTTRAAELFLNGVSKGVLTPTVSYSGATTNFNAGGSAGGVSNWNGYMKRIAVYERILSTAEILAHANGAKPY